jgi:NADH:ubiquinone oxidoreductase subunit 2 (subunit N)
LELQALSLFVLASYKTDSVFSSEAGLKYFIAGAFISGIFLLGCSLIYGSIGTLNFDLMVPLIMEGDSTLLNGNAIFSKTVFSVGILLVVVTLMFKVGAAPVHF